VETGFGTGSWKRSWVNTIINISSRVESIGEKAFWGCSNLKEVTLPDGLTSIPTNAFYGCSKLTSINIPEGTISIGSSAFYECSSLTTISIPPTVDIIYDNAFYGCTSLASVVLTSYLTITSGAFSRCTKLRYILYEGSQNIGCMWDLDAIGSLEFVCIPPDVSSPCFGNLMCESDSSCDDLIQEMNECFEVDNCSVRKKESISSWEDLSSKYTKYLCENESGFITRNLYNGTDSEDDIWTIEIVYKSSYQAAMTELKIFISECAGKFLYTDKIIANDDKTKFSVRVTNKTRADIIEASIHKCLLNLKTQYNCPASFINITETKLSVSHVHEEDGEKYVVPILIAVLALCVVVLVTLAIIGIVHCVRKKNKNKATTTESDVPLDGMEKEKH